MHIIFVHTVYALYSVCVCVCLYILNARVYLYTLSFSYRALYYCNIKIIETRVRYFQMIDQRFKVKIEIKN